MLVVAAGSPLATSPPSLRELAQQPLVGFRSGGSTDPVEAAFRAERVEPRWAFRSNDNQTVQGLVAAGMGCAIVPLLTVDTSDPRIAVVDLRGAVQPRVVGIGRHRDRYASPAARAFLDTALAA